LLSKRSRDKGTRGCGNYDKTMRNGNWIDETKRQNGSKEEPSRKERREKMEIESYQ